jgi:hypothetical protein
MLALFMVVIISVRNEDCEEDLKNAYTNLLMLCCLKAEVLWRCRYQTSR